MATVRALAWSAELPVVPVTSLEVMAAGMPSGSALAAPIIDARKGQVYAALYEAAEGRDLPREVLAPFVDDPDRALARLRRAAGERELLAAGDGIDSYAEIFGAVPRAAGCFGHPRAAVAAWVGRQRALRTGAQGWESLVPVYLRPSEAEENIGPPTGETRLEVR